MKSLTLCTKNYFSDKDKREISMTQLYVFFTYNRNILYTEIGVIQPKTVPVYFIASYLLTNP